MAKMRAKPILIPDKVQVVIDGQELKVRGPLGELKMTIPKNLRLDLKDKTITVLTPDNSRESKGLQGTTRTLILNLIKGVTEGYSKTLVVQGIGYRAQLVSGGLQLFVGFTKPVTVPLPPNIKCELQTLKSADKKGDMTHITLRSSDKKLLGDTAAYIRRIRPPDPYQHKGIKYADEVLRKKVGKRAVAQTA